MCSKVTYSYVGTSKPIFSRPSNDIIITRIALLALASSFAYFLFPSYFWGIPLALYAIKLILDRHDPLVHWMYDFAGTERYEKLPSGVTFLILMRNYRWDKLERPFYKFEMSDGRKVLLIDAKSVGKTSGLWGLSERRTLIILVERLSVRDYNTDISRFFIIFKQALSFSSVNRNLVQVFKDDVPPARNIILAGYLPYELLSNQL